MGRALPAPSPIWKCSACAPGLPCLPARRRAKRLRRPYAAELPPPGAGSSGSELAFANSGLAESCGALDDAPSASAVRPGLVPAWESATRALFHLATLCFVAGTVVTGVTAAGAPPLTAGSATAPLAWVSTLSTLTSFFILSSTFIDDGEAAGIVCYVAGFVGTYLLFLQEFLGGGVPHAAFFAATALAGTAAVVNAAKLVGALDQWPGVWQRWREFAGCVGWALLPQIAWLTLCAPRSPSWAPALLSGAAGVALLRCSKLGVLPRSCHSSWDVGSWCATLLFMTEPLAVLAACARDSATLSAAPPASFLLPALATGLQVPRALRAHNHMWFTGTSWSTVAAAAHAALAAFAAGRWDIAVLIVAAVGVFYRGLLAAHAAVEGLPSWRHSLRRIRQTYRDQMRPFAELRKALKV